MDMTSEKFEMGNQTLTDLWNICPDNLAACQDTGRKFTPEVGLARGYHNKLISF